MYMYLYLLQCTVCTCACSIHVHCTMFILQCIYNVHDYMCVCMYQIHTYHRGFRLLDACSRSHSEFVVFTQVYGNSNGGNITLLFCIEDHKFSPQNFWNGRWRSEWTATFSPNGGDGQIKGVVRSQVSLSCVHVIFVYNVKNNIP